MGKRNRERRREKQRQRGRQRHQGGGPGRTQPLDDLQAAGTIFGGAAHASWAGDDVTAETLLRLLCEGPPVPGGHRIVDAAVADLLDDGLAAVWQRGWMPSDVHRAARHKLKAAHARLAAEAIVAETSRSADATMDPRWRDQVAGLEAEATVAPTSRSAGRSWFVAEGDERASRLRLAAELMGLLLHLPEIPLIVPPPGSTERMDGRVSGLDHKVLEKVRALLAKAESTTFPDEAEALTAKAQELMARHAVDRAMLDDAAGAGAGPTAEPSAVRLGIDDPYAGGKAMLIHAVASANRCRSVWSQDLGFATVFGFPADLDTVELLYTSLLVQATSAMAAAGSQTDRRGRSRTRSFRQSFLVAYAIRIGQRLQEARDATESAAAEDHGSRLLPVLATRTEAVDDAMRKTFPNLSSVGGRVTNPAGWHAGTVAAELASLSVHEQLADEVAVS